MNTTERDTIILGLAILGYGMLLWLARKASTVQGLDLRKLEFARYRRDDMIAEEHSDGGN